MNEKRKHVRLFRPSGVTSPHFGDSNYRLVIDLMKGLISRNHRQEHVASTIEIWSAVVARDHNKSIVIVDRDLEMPNDLAECVRTLRRATRSPDWNAITLLMIACPQHLEYDARSPDRVEFNAEAAGASELILHVLRRHHRYASDLAAEILHDADPIRNRKRLELLEKLRKSAQ